MKRLTLCMVALCMVAPGAAALSPTREDEIRTCSFPELPTWPDGLDAPLQHKRLQFIYTHAGAPRWMAAETVLSKIELSARAWSSCGLELLVVKESNAPLLPVTQTIVIQWSDGQSLGNFGVADRINRRLTLGPSAFELLRAKAPEAIKYSLQLVISHEMGHFLGLQRHSRRCIDVMSYYSDDKGAECISVVPNWKSGYREYRSHLPTACDIKRCKALNKP